MIRELKYILAVLIGVGMMVSCADEPIIQGSGDIPEGYAKVSAKVSFKPFGSALNGGSRTAGDAIKEIQSLYVVLYDEDKNLIDVFNAGEQNDQGGYKYDYIYEQEESRDDVEPGNNAEHIAEQKTPCAKFKKTIPYGRYYIYAVANYDLTDKDYSTIEKLRSLQLTWNANDVKSNNEMFGYFTNGKTNSKPNGWEADPVIIASPTVDLYAWIRRAASKVTVAYDGSKLNDNVYITIKSVQINQIPKNCKLGVDYGVENEDGLIKLGEIIEYATSGNDGPVITKGGVTWGSTYIEGWKEPYDPAGENGKAHTETSQALFFYENLQGKGEEGTATDKSVNKLIYLDKGKPNGTYVEVQAYYENRSLEGNSAGDIKYRFMLGKDAEIDYNAERNYHYKLTLHFNKDANDVDWRIDYEEKPGLYVPDVYYVSYLYADSTEMPLKIVIPEEHIVNNLTAEIIENNWFPDADRSSLNEIYYGRTINDFYAKDKSAPVVESIDNGNKAIPWVGFLSLRNELSLNGNRIIKSGNNDSEDGFGGSISAYAESTEPYNWWTDKNLGVRGDYIGDLGGNTGVNTKSVVYKIKYYTRLKQLYSESGFTGNNPYVGYKRTARVKFRAEIERPDGEKYYFDDEVKVIQVPRLVNPTGIWRSGNNTEPFQVALKEQEGWGGDFKDLISEGPWTAKMIKSTDSKWFSITPEEGVTGSKVVFTYTPNGTTNKPRCAIIEVKYHNNSCSHLIFVRQGYEPIKIVDETEWYSFNLKTKDTMTDYPLDEGSLYRYGKFEYPISEINNVPPSTLGVGVVPGSTPLLLADGTSKTWAEIGSVPRGSTFNTPMSGAQLPLYEDWNNLKEKAGHGYGVLYADGASMPAVTTTNSFGYRAAQGDRTRGMRGVFVYNKENGAHIFFPIGAVGHGHRKQEHAGGVNFGMLRYASVDKLMNDVVPEWYKYRPMLYGLRDQYGALYWVSDGNAWDMNFDQLDFNHYGIGNAWTDSDGVDETNDTDGSPNNAILSDACFVRLIKWRQR